MDFGAFRPRKIFSWRPGARSDTSRTDVQTPTTDAQAMTVPVSCGLDSSTC